MKKPIGSILHFNHFILYYEDERGARSYRLIDDQANTLATYDETEKDGKRIPADIGAATRLAKRRQLVGEAGAALAALEAEETSTDKPMSSPVATPSVVVTEVTTDEQEALDDSVVVEESTTDWQDDTE